MNMRGEVVGVVTSMLGIRDQARGGTYVLQNASYVKKIDCLKPLLGLLPHKDPGTHALQRRPDNLETLANRIQDSVMILIAR